MVPKGSTDSPLFSTCIQSCDHFMQVHAKAGKNAYILQNSALKISKAKKKK